MSRVSRDKVLILGHLGLGVKVELKTFLVVLHLEIELQVCRGGLLYFRPGWEAHDAEVLT